MSASDTIYALSSGAGRAAIAIIRLSGPKTRDIVSAIAGGLGEPRRHHLRRLLDPETGDVLDEAVVVWLPGPASFTGEDCAEFHVHASRAVLTGIFDVLSAFFGVRPAEAGEFSRRAVINGKMDLVEAEGLGDLLVAQTALQRRQALTQLLGKSSSVFDSWRERLLLIRADIEAAVDFADEEDVAEIAGHRVDSDIRRLLEEIEAAAAVSATAEAIREGVKVVLAGYPNTGKSSLLNAVSRRDAAIVSQIPGTTRDVIEVVLDIGGIPVILTDTAGLRSGVSDEVEREGISRSLREIRNGDIVIWVASGDVPGSDEYGEDVHPDLIVLGKQDVSADGLRLLRNDSSLPPTIKLSALTGAGVPEFIQQLTALLLQRLRPLESSIVISDRQKAATLDSIRMLNDSLTHGLSSLELKAENVRCAAEAIGRLTGRTEVEEWLGVIFSRFCIGK